MADLLHVAYLVIDLDSGLDDQFVLKFGHKEATGFEKRESAKRVRCGKQAPRVDLLKRRKRDIAEVDNIFGKVLGRHSFVKVMKPHELAHMPIHLPSCVAPWRDSRFSFDGITSGSKAAFGAIRKLVPRSVVFNPTGDQAFNYDRDHGALESLLIDVETMYAGCF